MPHKARIKKLAINMASLVIHFAHGGLLVTGILAAVLWVGTYNGALELPIKNAGAQDAPLVQPVSPPADRPAMEKVSLALDVSAEPLKPEMSAVANYLARRYHVSNQAIKPLVSAVQSAAARAGLDPLLILAVMAIESRFNPFAESVVGAQGLMQVMPRFHQDKLEANGAGKNALLEPHMNIQVGVLILKESISRAGNVQAGLQQYAGAPDDTEAQYAAKVMAEKQRLEQAARQIATRRSRQSESRA